ncbi:MAG TPA: site-2 protease family protein [Vicinamibacterales bacterium]
MDPARLDQPFPPTPDLPFHWEPRRKFQDRVRVHVVLLVLTIGATTLVGALHYLGFISDYSSVPNRALPRSFLQLFLPQFFVPGFWYSGTVLAILGCHELGHYFACRYYDVDASLPFFLPFPPGLPIPSIFGTFGAFIRIREQIPTKRMLFDIGIAGPIAGFLVAVPALFIGISMSHVVRIPPNFVGFNLGEPLLFKLVSKLLWGTIPDAYSLNMHPMAFAAWFGLLATALNLFPVGQLDGGHISYAVLGRRSTYVTIGTLLIAMVLAFFYSSWVVWTGLMIVMLYMFGPRHPRVFDEHIPLDRTRLILALIAVAMFVLCFTPAPIEPTELLRR